MDPPQGHIGAIIFLAVLQGVTEFLPVSSSGHLVLFQKLLGFEGENVTVAIVLHGGTLMSILAYYYPQLLQLCRPANHRVVGLIILGTLPVVFVGLVAKPYIETLFSSLGMVAAGLTVTAIFLLLVHSRRTGTRSVNEMTWKDALIIGLAQCVAIVPGVSRSGSTISVATRLGVSPTAAARYSFFLSIPAIAGANVLNIISLSQDHGATAAHSCGILTMTVGFFVAFAVGYFSLKLLIRTLEHKTFRNFGYYCIAVAAIVAVSAGFGV